MSRDKAYGRALAALRIGRIRWHNKWYLCQLCETVATTSGKLWRADTYVLGARTCFGTWYIEDIDDYVNAAVGVPPSAIRKIRKIQVRKAA